MINISIDLKGMRRGYLEVVCKNTEDERHGIYWLCRCHCPDCTKGRNLKMVSIRQDKLLEGRTLSCGYRKELQKTRSNRNTNKFEARENYYVGYTYAGEQFYFDKEDYRLVTSVSVCWSFNDSGYLVARDMRENAEKYENGRRKLVKLKDIIMNKLPGERIEYINKSAKFDNRKANLKKR